MFKYSLVLILLTTFSLNAQEHKILKDEKGCLQAMPNVVCKNNISIAKPTPTPKLITVSKPKVKKSTLDVQVANYLLPNENNFSFPVTVRKNSLEKDN